MTDRQRRQRPIGPDDYVARAGHLLSHRPELAEVESRKGLGLDPNHARAHKLLAISLNNQGRYQEALASADEAVALAAEEFDAHRIRALVLCNLRRLDEAQRAIEEALRLAPEAAANYDIACRIALTRGDWGEVVSLAEAGLRLDPAEPECTWMRVWALRARGELPQALAAARQALALLPTSSDVHFVFAQTLLDLGEFDAAAEHFAESLRLNPNSRDAPEARRQLRAAVKKRYLVYRAAHELSEAVQTVPRYAWVLLGLPAVRMVVRSKHPEIAVLFPLGALAGAGLLALLWWSSDIGFNAALATHRLGRLVLTPRQRKEAYVAIGCLSCALASMVFGWPFGWAAPALSIGCLLLPVSLIGFWRTMVRQHRYRWACAAALALAATSLLISVTLIAIHSLRPGLPTFWQWTMIGSGGLYLTLTLWGLPGFVASDDV